MEEGGANPIEGWNSQEVRLRRAEQSRSALVYESWGGAHVVGKENMAQTKNPSMNIYPRSSLISPLCDFSLCSRLGKLSGSGRHNQRCYHRPGGTRAYFSFLFSLGVCSTLDIGRDESSVVERSGGCTMNLYRRIMAMAAWLIAHTHRGSTFTDVCDVL